MLYLGLLQNGHLVYEGSSTSLGIPVWPRPVISAAKFVSDGEKVFSGQDSSQIAGSDVLVFREDYFDPIARVRRGRFYNAGDTQPLQWHVEAHPAYPSEAIQQALPIAKSLNTFFSTRVSLRLKGINAPIVLLGHDASFSPWSILEIEQIFTGEELVTLKARHSFGALPDLNEEAISEHERARIRSAIDHFSDEIYRSGVTSIIDRGRETAVEVLLTYLGEAARKDNGDAMDIGDIAKVLQKKELTIAANAATILGRLHARAKPAERASRAMPPIANKDSELAVHCLGTILREIGWANWR